MKDEFNLSKRAHFTGYDDKDRNAYSEEDDMLDEYMSERELYLSKQIDKLAGEKLK